MVRIAPHSRSRTTRTQFVFRLFIWAFAFIVFGCILSAIVSRKSLHSLEREAQRDFGLLRERVATVAAPVGNNKDASGGATPSMCPYMSLTDLTASERYPKASGERHMVTPPADTDTEGVTLVCCDTTKGPWNILVHHSWAPFGARRFLDMVEAAYFETTVPLMRCVRNFLCQFGLNGEPDAIKPFRKTLEDDPNWLPEGKDHRKNDLGVARFQRGYLAYAGAGPKSRNLQFIVALTDNGPLAGGSPWEVPWGELVGEHSFETLKKVHTGYGEKGPKQGLLYKAKALDYVHDHFPEMDYIQSCKVVDRHGGQGEPGSTMSRSA